MARSQAWRAIFTATQKPTQQAHTKTGDCVTGRLCRRGAQSKSEQSPCQGVFISDGVLSVAVDDEGRGAWAGAAGAVWQTPALMPTAARRSDCSIHTSCCCIARVSAQCPFAGSNQVIQGTRILLSIGFRREIFFHSAFAQRGRHEGKLGESGG